MTTAGDEGVAEVSSAPAACSSRTSLDTPNVAGASRALAAPTRPQPCQARAPCQWAPPLQPWSQPRVRQTRTPRPPDSSGSDNNRSSTTLKIAESFPGRSGPSRLMISGGQAAVASAAGTSTASLPTCDTAGVEASTAAGTSTACSLAGGGGARSARKTPPRHHHLLWWPRAAALSPPR
jgi:hypothetical protein